MLEISWDNIKHLTFTSGERRAEVLGELRFSGYSDDIVVMEGALEEEEEEEEEELYLREDDTWSGWIQAPSGDMAQLYASYCVENKNGWHLEVKNSNFEYFTYYPDGDEYNPVAGVPVISIEVPEGIVVED